LSNYALILILLSGIFSSCSSGVKQKAEADYAENVRDFLQTLAFENMDECYPDKQSWTQAALLKKSIDIEYKYTDDCKLKGKFTASYLDEIPMRFQLKEFDGFGQANALVKLHINQHRNGVFYGFEVKEGSLVSLRKTIHFTARYKVDTDPLTNELKEGTEKGEINIINPGTKQIKQTVPFSFH
jgi:hypothetical protein